MLSIKFILLLLFCYLIQDCASSSYLFSFIFILFSRGLRIGHLYPTPLIMYLTPPILFVWTKISLMTYVSTPPFLNPNNDKPNDHNTLAVTVMIGGGGFACFAI